MEQALGSGHRCAAGYPDVKRKVDGHLLTANQGWVLGEGGACTVHLWLQAVLLACDTCLPGREREREGACANKPRAMKAPGCAVWILISGDSKKKGRTHLFI